MDLETIGYMPEGGSYFAIALNSEMADLKEPSELLMNKYCEYSGRKNLSINFGELRKGNASNRGYYIRLNNQDLMFVSENGLDSLISLYNINLTSNDFFKFREFLGSFPCVQMINEKIKF